MWPCSTPSARRALRGSSSSLTCRGLAGLLHERDGARAACTTTKRIEDNTRPLPTLVEALPAELGAPDLRGVYFWIACFCCYHGLYDGKVWINASRLLLLGPLPLGQLLVGPLHVAPAHVAGSAALR